jgi:membrane-associated phospholipid phosphatase
MLRQRKFRSHSETRGVDPRCTKIGTSRVTEAPTASPQSGIHPFTLPAMNAIACITNHLQSKLTNPLTVTAAALAISFASGASADEVIRWNQIATDAATAAKTDPLTESRIFAIMHVAIHDAVNSIEPRYDPYQLKKSSAPGASIEAAIAAAAHDTLVVVFPTAKSTFDTAMQETLRTLPDNLQKPAGLEVGQKSAKAILAARENDGANRTVQYIPGTQPGEYCPTPPDFTPAFVPHWGNITPFVLKSAAQFRPAEPPAVNSPRALADIAEVRAIGGINSTTRTAEQSEIARYWYENSPTSWNRIAREVSPMQHLNVWENARLFALVNLAMADGFIAGFETKYHYNYWRPVTAIRQGGDAEWLSFLWTPPVPDYPSTHTVLGAAAATVMARFFNTDLVCFAMTSGEPNAGITRKFWSFSQAARENGASRILCGIHFRTAVNAGYEQGERVGEWVFEHALRPSGPIPATAEE